MSSKVQRKVTVENVKESGDGPRRPSVFERLGPGALTNQERRSRDDPGEQCRNWMRSGACSFGSKCRYQHEAYPPSSSSSSSSRLPKSERDSSQKDLRHKVRHKQQDFKESDSRSPSPKRRKVSTSSGAGGGSVTVTTAVVGSSTGGSSSRSRRTDAESKIKSQVVVTRPRSPLSGEDETSDGLLDCEEDNLELKRQQLQRELDLLQKDNHPSSSGSAGSKGGAASSGTIAASVAQPPPPSETPGPTKSARSAQPTPQGQPSGSSESSSESDDSSSSDSSSSSSDDEDDDDDSEDSSSSTSSGAASPSAGRSSGGGALPPAVAEGQRHHRGHRGSAEERGTTAHRSVDGKSSREPSRTGSSSHGHDKDAGRHGRDRHRGQSREPPEAGRMSPSRRGGGPRDGVDYDRYAGRSRGPRTPSPGPPTDSKRKAASSSAQPSKGPPPPYPPGKLRKKKKSGKRRRDREKQLRAERARVAQSHGAAPFPESPSPERQLSPPSSRHRGSREGGMRGAPPSRSGRYGPPSSGRSPPPPRDGSAAAPGHRGAGAPSKRPRRETPPPPPSSNPAQGDGSVPPPPPAAPPSQLSSRDSRKKDGDSRHGRPEDYGGRSDPKGYDGRYDADASRSGRKRGEPGHTDQPPPPPPPPHRGTRHDPLPPEDAEMLEPGEVLPEHTERYVGERGRYDQGRGRDGRRMDHHRSRSPSPALAGLPPRSRMDMDMHRMDYPHSPRSRNQDSRGKSDLRGSDGRRGDPYIRGDPRGDLRGDMRVDPRGDLRADTRVDPRDPRDIRVDPRGDSRSDPRGDLRDLRRDPRGGDSRGDLRGDPRIDSRGDLRGGDPYRRGIDLRGDQGKQDIRGGDYHSRGDYHGRGDLKPDYHSRGDPYSRGGDGRVPLDPYGRSSDYRDGRDLHSRMDLRGKDLPPPPRMDRGDLPGYDPRSDDYGRLAEDYYARVDRRDYYADGYGPHRSELRDRGPRDLRRPEHVSRMDVRGGGEPHLKGRLEPGGRGEHRRNDSRGRDERGYGLSRLEPSSSRSRGDPRGSDDGPKAGGRGDPYERGEPPYRGGGDPGHRGEPRGSDSRGDPGRRGGGDYKGRGAAPSRIDDSGPSRYSRREADPLLDARDSRTGSNRDGRGGGRSRSVSPNRGYERRRPPARSTKEVSKRGEGDGKPEMDDVREGGSGGSRGSSPRRAREKAPATKTSRSSSQDEAAERPDQSPDTSMPEAAVPKVEVASPVSEESGGESPTKAEISDSSKHMVLVEECKSEDDNEEGQEAKVGGGDTYSDWSDDDDDDILTRGEQAVDLDKKDALSDAHMDTSSRDKPEEAGDPNLIEVDAVPISPEESPRSAQGEGATALEDEFDPISDDELEALIDESQEKEPAPEPEPAISDVLDIDWSILVKESSRTKDGTVSEKRGSARERYSGARVLARIGISRDLAGEELAQQVVEFCQKELAKDKKEPDEQGAGEEAGAGNETAQKDEDFQLENLTAGFHAAAVAARRQQNLALESCGRYCRALSARRDLMLRRALCKVYEPSSTEPATNVDLQLYRRSLQLYQSRTQVQLAC